LKEERKSRIEEIKISREKNLSVFSSKEHTVKAIKIVPNTLNN